MCPLTHSVKGIWTRINGVVTMRGSEKVDETMHEWSRRYANIEAHIIVPIYHSATTTYQQYRVVAPNYSTLLASA